MTAMPVQPSPWQAARHILAIRLDNLGDVLMSTPAIRALRESGPAGRRIVLLASPAGAAAAPFIPEIDRHIAAAMPWLPGAAIAPAGFAGLVEDLRAEAFEAAVIFTVYSQNPLPAALLCWQAGIPLVLAHARENPYRLLSDWVPEPEPHATLRHEVRRQLDLVATVGATAADERLSFRLRDSDREAVRARLLAAGIDPGRRWVVVHPGASAPARRYPAEHFAALANLLAELPDLQLVLAGDGAEAELVEAIRSRLRRPAAALAGSLGLGELAALIAGAALLVANNSGPVHLAAAVGTPVVDIYALTNPQHAPWRVPHRVLFHDVPCRFCYRSVCPQEHHDCLRRIAPERVAEAARELLAGAERCPGFAAPAPAPLSAGV